MNVIWRQKAGRKERVEMSEKQKPNGLYTKIETRV